LLDVAARACALDERRLEIRELRVLALLLEDAAEHAHGFVVIRVLVEDRAERIDHVTRALEALELHAREIHTQRRARGRRLRDVDQRRQQLRELLPASELGVQLAKALLRLRVAAFLLEDALVEGDRALLILQQRPRDVGSAMAKRERLAS